MSASEVAPSAQELVTRLSNETFQRIRNWYSDINAQFILDKTNRGQLSFTWEATYDDGSKFYQYDEVSFYRALTDEVYVPNVEQIISTGTLDKKKTVEFILHPLAFTRRLTPWFAYPYRVCIKPDKGERLLAFWEVDYRPVENLKLHRTVVGIALVDSEEKEISRSVLVLSPSGSMTFANSTNVSFEGE